MHRVRIQREPIDPADLIKKTGTPADGAVLSFCGTARNRSAGREVLYLYYDIYPDMALKELEKIADLAVEKWKLGSCIIIHRYGRVEAGEISVFIGISTPHRNEGFDALRYIIDSIKRTVPIWKKEHFADGSVWVSGQH